MAFSTTWVLESAIDASKPTASQKSSILQRFEGTDAWLIHDAFASSFDSEDERATRMKFCAVRESLSQTTI
jgi:hypothetical protein